MFCDVVPTIEDIILYSCGYDLPCKHVWPSSPYYMMYMYLVKKIVFHIIEHGILGDDFVKLTSICLFQVLLCSLYSESSKLKIVMYFGYPYPLTSHIKGHLLYLKMELLCLSNDTKCVVTQKDIMDRSIPNFIRGLDP